MYIYKTEKKFKKNWNTLLYSNEHNINQLYLKKLKKQIKLKIREKNGPQAQGWHAAQSILSTKLWCALEGKYTYYISFDQTCYSAVGHEYKTDESIIYNK